jgi:hypothetical protein
LKICDILLRFLELVNKNGNGELDEDLIKKMQSYLIERNRDANIEVQKMAIRASSLLQFPRDKFCPIIRSFVYLLKHESMVEIKNLVLNYIAINQLTFNLIKCQIIFDTNPLVSNKALSIIRKKVPCEFIDAKLKRILIVRLIQNDNMELLEAFVLKWLDDEDNAGNLEERQNPGETCLKFIENLDLEKIWYHSLEFKDINYVDKTLQKVMDFVCKNVTRNSKTLENTFEKVFEREEKFLNLNHAFFCRSLLDFLTRSTQKLELKLNLQQFDIDFMYIFKDKIPNSLTAFNLIHCLFHFHSLKYVKEIFEQLFDWLFSLNFDDSHVCLYELIMNRFEKCKLNQLVWTAFTATNLKEVKEVEKFLSILSLFLAKLTKEEYEEMELVDLTDLGIDFDMDEGNMVDLHENMIDFLVNGLILIQISSSDAKVRSLSVRSIGNHSIF